MRLSPVTTALLALATLSGCAGLVASARNFGPLGDNSCEAYLERARGYSYDMHLHDWGPFANILASPPDGSADLLACRDMARNYGAPIIYRKQGRSGVSLYFAILLPGDFESWDDGLQGAAREVAVQRQAQLLCHEVQHIAWEKRIGPERAAAVYVDESGTLAAEGSAYAVSEALARRYSWPVDAVAKANAERWGRFPERYVMGHAVDPECVGRHMAWAYSEFEAWASKLPPAQ